MVQRIYIHVHIAVITKRNYQSTLTRMLPSVGHVTGEQKNLRRLVRRWGDISHIHRWKDFDADIELGDLDNLFAKEEETSQRLDLPNEFQTLTGRSQPASARVPLNYLRKRAVEQKDVPVL